MCVVQRFWHETLVVSSPFENINSQKIYNSGNGVSFGGCGTWYNVKQEHKLQVIEDKVLR
jgi:hypothetical protein